MTDRLSLTAAELAFLLSVSDDAAGSPTTQLLGFTDADRTDPVIAAGLGSLLLRHLAVPAAAQQIQLAAPVTAITEGLTRPRVCIQLGLVTDRIADGALLFEAGEVRFLLAPRAFRCYDVTGIDPAAERTEPLIALARAFLDRHRPAVAAFTVVTPSADHPRVTVAVTEDGQVSLVSAREPDVAVTGLGLDDALQLLGAELGRLVPSYARAG